MKHFKLNANARVLAAAMMGVTVLAPISSVPVMAASSNTSTVENQAANGDTNGDIATISGFTSTPSVTADNVNPTASDKATIAVAGIENNDTDEDADDVTVTAYQIVKATYGTNGLTGYEPVISDSIADVSAPTSDEITTLAGKTSQLTNTVELTKNDTYGYYSASVNAGTWLVLVKSNYSDTVYNPMIVSADYTDANQANSLGQDTGNAAVDSETHFHIGSTTAYAKQTTPTVDKKITNHGTVGNEYGDAVGLQTGDELDFEIDTQLPSFSKDYSYPKFWIKDTLSNGLTLNENSIKVTVGGTELVKDGTTQAGVPNGYKVVKQGQVFTIAIDQAVLEAHRDDSTMPDVVVTYKANLNEDAESVNQSIPDNGNNVVLQYTTDPDESSDAIPPEGPSTETHEYTFALEQEIAKIDKSGSVSGGTVSTAGTAVDANISSDTALEGATFVLYQIENEDGEVLSTYNDSNNTITAVTGQDADKLTHTYTTGEDGLVKFSQLDAGVYKLKETNAPDNYTVNDTVYTVTITPTFDTDGVMTKYTVSVSDGTTTNTSTYNDADKDGNVDAGSTLNPTAIKDTKLSNLPSTGGAGTTIITVSAAAGMAFCFYVFSKNRKKA